MPGPWVENDSEPSDHYTTKIGGLLDWSIPQLLSSKPHLLQYATCEKDLCLVAQVYALIFGKIQKTVIASSPVVGWNNDIWMEEENDENDEDIDLEELGRVLFEAASMASFSKKRHAKPTVKSSPLSPGTRKEQTQKAISNEEVYEYMGAWNTDRTYFRFRKCLDAYLGQCFRYAYGGKATSGYGRGRRPREMQALWRFNAL
ncbi:uncharacterized protein LOC109123671 [Vitis vinifera]|uniref:uncharacterized protein LOC109123671 n=1 Tax=Vitis vinifera TaxID=29760 RepID=UPI0008FEC091|nr:uncharacterized protein LOC109123671 [Vitis vinifera]|eukprot:XP_019079617.1 PREDICTED: uncharacterized protein LOC109123671 [Vitis vinifera]